MIEKKKKIDFIRYISNNNPLFLNTQFNIIIIKFLNINNFK